MFVTINQPGGQPEHLNRSSINSLGGLGDPQGLRDAENRWFSELTCISQNDVKC